MRHYAEGTSVTVENSKSELDRLLSKHGATQRGIMSDDLEGRAIAVFVLHDRQYRIEVPLPKLSTFTPVKGKEPNGWWRKTVPQREEWCRKQQAQAARERWRAVVLLLKAKLELVALGLSSVEKEFLADLVLPGGQSLHQALGDQIKEAYLSGKMPPLMLGPGGSR